MNTISSIPNYIIKIFVLVVAYYATAELGYQFSYTDQMDTLIWPASSLLIAFLFLYGLNLWPAIVIGSLLIASLQNQPLSATAGEVIAQSLEVVVIAGLLRRSKQFDVSFGTFECISIFLVCAALIGPILGATTITISSLFNTAIDTGSLFSIWWHWLISHSISHLVVIPAIFAFTLSRHRQWNKFQIIEFLVASLGLIVICFLVFIKLSPMIGNYPLGHVTFPFLLWLALRFSQQEVSIMNLIVTFIAVTGTANGSGPFSRLDVDANLLLLSTFVVAVVVTSLVAAVITNQRRVARAELQQSNDELEARVEARTADLLATNSQLEMEIEHRKLIERDLAKARDQALNALQTKTQILTNVGHEVRTPLSVINLHAQLLQKERYGALSPKQKKYTDKILLGSDDLLGFMDKLLTEAQLRSSAIEPDLSSIDLNDWLPNILERYRLLAEKKQLTFTSEIANNFPTTIETDTEWLEQIVTNLVDNAIKFTNTGVVQIYIDALNEESWRFRILDTGPGIPEEMLIAIFDAFGQVDSSETREHHRGVGLGLSIAKQKSELLGGSITVQNLHPTGSEFTVVLPIS